MSLAQPRPSLAAREPLLGGEHAVAGMGGDMALEIRFVAEQAEAVLDLPDDAKLAAGTGAAAAQTPCRSWGQGGGGQDRYCKKTLHRR